MSRLAPLLTRLLLVAGVALVAFAIAQAPALGALAPIVLGVLLLVLNGSLVPWTGHRRVRASATGDSFVGPLIAAWLILLLLPAHNFSYRPNSEAVSSIALQPLVELALFMLCGLVALVVIRTAEPTLDRARPPLVLFLLPVWATVSCLWALIGLYAFVRGWQMLAISFMGWATLALARVDPDAFRRVMGGILRWYVRTIALLVALGAAFGPIYVPTSPENLKRFSWIGAHPNGSGLLMAVAAVILVTTPPRVLRHPAWVSVAALGGLAVVMYLNHSRTAWACLAGGLVLAVLLSSRLHPLVRWVGIPLMAVGGVVAIMFMGDDIWGYILRDRDTESLATGNGRLELWGIGIRALDGPFDWLAGLGYGAARTVFIAEVPWATTAHNSLLSLLVATGVIGAVLLLAIVFQVVRDVLVSRAHLEPTLGLPLVCVTLVLLLNGVATDILAEPNIGFAGLVLAGAAARAWREARETALLEARRARLAVSDAPVRSAAPAADPRQVVGAR